MFAGFRADLAATGLHFEGRPYPVAPVPVLLTDSGWADVVDLSRALHRLLERAVELYRAVPALRAELFADYAPWEPLLTAPPALDPALRVCRLDCLWSPGDGLTLLETNTACPGGVVQTGRAVRTWLDTEWGAIALAGRRRVPQPLVDDPWAFVRMLARTAVSAGVPPAPAAVVNLRGQYTNEVDWIVGGLRELGVEAYLRDARSFELRDGWATAEGRRHGLLYPKLDPLALITDPAAAAFRTATGGGRSCVAVPLVAQLVTEDKAVLALLTDERHADLLTPAERDTARRHIPWTRLLRPGRTTSADGSRVELVDHVRRQRRRLVLKPANSTRGEGVVIGPQVDEATWSAAVTAALGSRCVVQQHVPHPTLGPVDDGPAGLGWPVVLGSYLFAGQPVGIQARAAGAAPVNVGHGGVVLPVVVVETRPDAARAPGAGRGRALEPA
jgi:hypothetical protein